MKRWTYATYSSTAETACLVLLMLMLAAHRRGGVQCIYFSNLYSAKATNYLLRIPNAGNRRTTHPSGWICRAERQWAERRWVEQAWIGLPYHWLVWSSRLRGKKSRRREEELKGTRQREEIDWGLYIYCFGLGTGSCALADMVCSLNAASCCAFTSFRHAKRREERVIVIIISSRALCFKGPQQQSCEIEHSRQLIVYSALIS